MRCSSPAFEDGKLIPTKYAHPGVTGGKNISLPISWEGAPAGTRSFALSIVDPHPVAGNWIHWFVTNIPSHVTSLGEGASQHSMPTGSKELYNSYGTIGYGGPEPPKGSGPHPYVVTVYALSVEKIDLVENSSLKAFLKGVGEHQVGVARVTGVYER